MAPERPRHDPLTLVAIALLAYVVGDVLHEAVGHGGACLVVGGRPLVLSTVHFECDSQAAGTWRPIRAALGGGAVARFRPVHDATPLRADPRDDRAQHEDTPSRDRHRP